MNATIQGEFLSRDTEVPKDFLELQDKVKLEKADFGVGYDSDGDRCIFINEKGEFIHGDYSATLVAKSIEGDVVVTPVGTSQVIDLIGKKVERTKVGSPYVVEKMKEAGATFGFESNGGGIFKDMLSRDGGRMTITLLNLLKQSGKKLSELVSELPMFYILRDKVQYKWELKDKIINEAKVTFKGIKTQELDGLKIWLDKTTWILFRSSQNAPEFRVFVESDVEGKANDLFKKGIGLVNKLVKESGSK
jgi:phosphomannomutase/phosphoglucomutase